MSAIYPAGIDPTTPVALDRCDSYDVDTLETLIRRQLEALGCADMFDGKRVAIKPNMVMKKSPDAAATTHPAVLEAMLRILKERAADIVIAESPGGVYTEQLLRSTYRGCGLAEVAERMEVRLNYDTSARDVEAPDGKTSKMFSLITPILDADVIVNLCKLKSHSLTGYSGAVKNYFGTIPGVQKFEMHARFPDYNDFGSMLVDLCAYHVASKPTFNLLDGIVAMEGNGPTSGTPRKVGCLLSGCNPFTVDRAATAIVDIDGVIMLEEAARRGFCPATASQVKLLSDLTLEDVHVDNFIKPDTVKRPGVGVSMFRILPKLFGGRLYKWLQPRPDIDAKTCVGCGECARSCPRHTIEVQPSKDGKKRAVIAYDACIRCYCCQELCPFKAVKIHKNPIIRLIGG
ncbi:MAG: DUF362 domain-containing protein [Clostridia bacterium]|nr:DUF362 domain-containing protein [Clostridia bacterium]